MAQNATTDDDAQTTTLDTHAATVEAVQNGDVSEGATIRVRYEGVNGEEQTDRGTVTDAEVVEEGTEKGKGNRTWVVSTTFYRITYTVEGANDRTLSGELGGGAPTVYTEVHGDHAHGGDRRTIGAVMSITVEEDPFDSVTGEHDDDYPDTVEVVETREVEREYSDETRTTAVLKYTIEQSANGRTLNYEINGVRIGCPKCKRNSTAIIRPDGCYECVCGYENDLSRVTLFHQQTTVEDVWEP